MSIYDTFKIINSNNFLSFTDNNKKLFELSQTTNNSYTKINSPEYGFLNTDYGISFNSNTNNIIFKSQGNIFTSDIYITGKINASEFPSNVLLLNQNNKIDTSYLPLIDNNIIITSNVIGIGVSKPLGRLHIKDGDTILENSRLGIGTTIPAYNLHINKNDNMVNTPVFVITKSNKHILDIYTEKELIIINDDGNRNINSNVKLNICGLTSTKSLAVSNNVFIDNQITKIDNDLYINNINSFNNQIKINSNTDLIINNTSIKSILSNVKEINECFDIENKNIIFSSNIYFDIDTRNDIINIINNSNKINITNSNLIIKDILNENIITSNIKLLNYDSLTSNPNVESVFDIKGKIKLYNDSPYIIKKCFINNNNLYLITSNNKLYQYNLINNNFIIISNDFNYEIFKAKYNSYGYYYNKTLTIINNSITYTINNIIIKDFELNNIPNNSPYFIYYINQNNHVVSYNMITLSETINTLRNDIIKIETYNDNTYVVLASNNKIYYYDGNIYTEIIFNPIQTNQIKIKDISSGDNHTLILTENGVWSFGYTNTNNFTYKKGYSNESTLSTIAYPIYLFNKTNDFEIVKIKANNNSSIVLDNKGFIYIFGTINKLFSINIISKINEYSNIIDFCCNNSETFFITYYNDIIKIIENNNTQILLLPNEFYGTSIKSRGSIIIGGNNFNKEVLRNSLLVENFVGIGSNIPLSSNNNYSMIVSGNINIINGSIYNNGILLSSTNTNNNQTNNINNWQQNSNNIYFTSGNVGIGLVNPRSKFHLNGNAIFDDDVYINGNLYTNEYKPLNINKRENIYYTGLFGINNKNPISSLDIFDGSIRLTDIDVLSNNKLIINFSSNIITTSTNTAYISEILLSQDNSTIINSFYNLEQNFNNNNNSNVEIYRNINNNWNIYKIRDIGVRNTGFGESISISKDGKLIYIGAYKERNSLNIITGGIYRYYFDNNNLQRYENTEILFNSANNNYYQIGRNINCSGDGNILISTIENYSDLLYIKNINTNKIELLDFSKYNDFHSSFIISYTTNQYLNNSYSHNNIIIDSVNDGSIIIINFNYNFSLIPIQNFIYFNFYIIKDYQIYLLKFNNNFNNLTINNSYITSISITDDGSKIFITTLSGYHFIYEFNFKTDIYKIINFNLNTNLFYYDKTPSYVFYKKDNLGFSNYRGKISKSGSIIFLGNNNKTFIYKLNHIDKTWIEEELKLNINQIQNINNYSVSLDYEGYNCAVSYILKKEDTNIIDKIEIINNYLNIIKEKTNFHLTNKTLNVEMNSYFTSNIYAKSFYGNGFNLSNISMDKIINNNQLGVVYTSNNRVYNNNNFYWLDNNNSLNINGIVSISSNLFINGASIFNTDVNRLDGVLNIYKGGTGRTFFQEGSLLIGNNSNQLNTYSNLKWDCNINTLILDNISITSNISVNSRILLSNLGINTCNISGGELLFTLNNSFLTYNSDIRWLNNQRILNINNGSIITSNINVLNLNTSNIITSNIITSNIISSNIITSNIITSNIISSNIISSNIISSNIISSDITSSNITSSNIITSNITSSNIITSNITSSNIISSDITSSNITSSNIITSNITSSNIISSDITSSNITSSNIITSNIISSDITSSNIIASNIYGDGSNITNITISNINGIIPVNKGGTGKNSFIEGLILIGNNINEINTYSNLKWDCNINTLILDNLFINSNINVNPNLLLSNLGINSYNINGGELLFGINSNNINFNSNLRWLNDTNILDITNGSLITSNLFSTKIFLNSNDDLEIILFNNSNNLYNFTNENINNTSNIFNLEISNTSNFLNNKINNTSNIFNLEISNTSNFLNNKINNTSNIVNLEISNTSNFLNNKINNTSNIVNLEISNTSNSLNNKINNINANTLLGILPLGKGGLGINNINEGEILFGFNSNNINRTSNFKWSNNEKILNINQGSILTSNISIQRLVINGKDLTQLDVSSLNGIIPVDKGGTGLSTINNGLILFGNNTTELSTNNNFKWENNNSLLLLPNINISSNLIINGFNFNNLNTDTLKIGSSNRFIRNDIYERDITFTKNLITSNLITSNLNVIGDYTILNTNVYQTEQLQIINDTTATTLIIKQLNNNQNLLECYNNNELTFLINANCNIGIGKANPIEKLDINGNIKANKLFINNNDIELLIITTSNNLNTNIVNTSNRLNTNIINTSNILNTNLNLNIVNTSNNLNTNIVNTSNILNTNLNLNINNTSNNLNTNIVNTSNRLNTNIINTSNILNTNLNLNIVNTSNNLNNKINNINANTLLGILPLEKGGLGINNINEGEILFGFNSSNINRTSNFKWSNNEKILNINQGSILTSNINTQRLVINGKDLTQLDISALNGIIPVDKGGTGLTLINQGYILYGGNTTNLNISSNLFWNNSISTLIVQNITINSNVLINGNINGNGYNLSNIDLLKTSNILQVNKGGTGLTSINQGYILYGGSNNNNLNISSNLFWNTTNNSLGIGGTLIPKKTIDILGDINISGDIYKNNILFSNIYDWKQSINDSNTIYTNKNLYIDYTSNDNYYKFKVNGNIFASGEIYCSSDINLKTNISNITEPIKKLEKINGVYYNLISNQKRCIGLIAQEVEKIIPEIVYTNVDNTKGIAYNNMMGLIVESIKELSYRIEKLEEKINYNNII
jgi:hypothetical protein